MKFKSLLSCVLAGTTALAVSTYANEFDGSGQQSALDELSFSQSSDIAMDGSSAIARTWYYPDGSVVNENTNAQTWYYPDGSVAYEGSNASLAYDSAPDVLASDMLGSGYPDWMGT